MELLSNPKTKYLLDASLEFLHAESLEWLKEIDFWQDEIAFFYKLLHKKEPKNSFPREALASMEKKLVDINSDKLDKVRSEIQSHERSLAAVLKTTSLQEEENYREIHRKLLRVLYEINVLIRNFKKDVFSFVRKYES